MICVSGSTETGFAYNGLKVDDEVAMFVEIYFGLITLGLLGLPF